MKPTNLGPSEDPDAGEAEGGQAGGVASTALSRAVPKGGFGKVSAAWCRPVPFCWGFLAFLVLSCPASAASACEVG